MSARCASTGPRSRRGPRRRPSENAYQPYTWADVALAPLDVALASDELPGGVYRGHNAQSLATFALGEKRRRMSEHSSGCSASGRRDPVLRRPIPIDHRSRQRHARGANGTLTGVAAVDRDSLHVLSGSVPFVLAFVLILTLVLLTRAFCSSWRSRRWC